MARLAFCLDVGDGVDLVLRELWTVQPLHELILGNLGRLREWEQWAQGEQTEDGLRAYTRHLL